MDDFGNAGISISAVILDLDGTILNTEQATKDILKEFLERYGKVLNKEKEAKRLGMTQKEAAAAIVVDYDLSVTPDQFTKEIMPMYRNKWPEAKALPGADRLIKHLHKNGVPLALASNSLRTNIYSKISHQQGWIELFSVILGSDQVKSGKPSPDIFLEAAKQMGVDAVQCLVIEDSLVGVKAAKAAGMKVVAVPSLQNEADKYSFADSVLHSILEFQPELWGLLPFQDWVNEALPVDAISFKGLYSDGFINEFPDNQLFAFPDQVFGVYFGWAKFDMCKVFKVVISIGWDHGCCSSKRKIQAFVLDESNDHICHKQMQALLVGYIRGLCSTAFDHIEINEEDKLIARACLDLPAFAQGMQSVF